MQILRPCLVWRDCTIWWMSEGREIRVYEYVNQPYEKVRDAVLRDPSALFRRATNAAASRARDVATGLRVNVGGIEIGAEIDLVVDGTETHDRPGAPQTTLKLRWRGANRPGLFPTMEAELSLYPLSPRETQLDLLGHYRPPLGVVGSAMDVLVGHRIAEASVHRFVDDIAERLEQELATD